MLMVLIIILLIQKCYYFHVNWYFLIIYILTQRKKCYRVLEYNVLCSSSALQHFCYITALWFPARTNVLLRDYCLEINADSLVSETRLVLLLLGH